MTMVVLSVLLALLALAGMAFTMLVGSLATVDGLFTTLILAVMFVIFAINSLYELRGLRTSRVTTQPKIAPAVAPSVATKPSVPAKSSPEEPRVAGEMHTGHV